VRSDGLRKLAKVKLSRSESGAHHVFSTYGQSIDVKISRTDLPSKRGFPYVSFVNWLRYLVEYDQLEHLVGVKDLGEMNKILLTFWDKFSKIHTEHVISTKDTAFRKMCIPVLLHGDEGRGLKKKQLMVLATHGILGKGCSHSMNDDGGEALRLNMVGNTWLNHFLQCVLPISLYNETPEAFFHMLDLQAKEYKQLFEEGLVVQGRRYYVCCVGVKGDAPFISKSGKFERAFTRRPTRASSKKAADGICHLCLAGKENYDFPVPFEEYGVQRPAWLWTVGSVCPYSEPSPLLQIPFEIGGTTEALWCFDLFHNFHSGLGKYFASSAVCICLELVQLSIDDAFNFITADFNSYCRRNKESPYHKRLTKALFGVEQGFQDCPDGGWSKGDFTRLVLKWFGDYTSRHVLGKTNDQLYLKCVSLALCILWYSFVLVGVGVLNMGISISKFACFPTAAFPVRLKQPWRSTSAWEGSTVRVFSSQQPGQNALRDKVCNFYVATLGWLGKAMKDK
jgi:hypothetical protein